MPDPISKLYQQNKKIQAENKDQYETGAYGNIIDPNKASTFDPSILNKISFRDNRPVQPIGEYTDYLPQAALMPADSDINLARAEVQPWTEQAGNVVKRAIPNILLGAVGNVASMFDVEDYINIDDEFGNPISNAMNDSMEWIRSKAPIYRKRPGASFDFSDPGYIFENVSQLLDSAGAFVLSGYLTGSAISAATKAISSGTLTNVLARNAATKADKLIASGAIKAAEKEGYIAGYVQKMESITPTVLSAYALNQAENVMEGAGHYKDTYNKKLDEGFSDDHARQAASDAASVGLNINRMNFLLNLSSAGLFTGAKTAIEKGFGSFTKELFAESGQEALEEGVNYVAQKEAELKGDQEGKYGFDLGRAVSHLGETQGLESMMLGAVGGGGQLALSRLIIPASDYGKQAVNKVRTVVNDLADASILSGRRSPLDKLNTLINSNNELKGYMQDQFADENLDINAKRIAQNTIAGDLENINEGDQLKLPNTDIHRAWFQATIDNEKSTQIEKDRAKAAINNIDKISKIVTDRGVDVFGKPNSSEILSTLVAMEDTSEKLSSLNSEISRRESLPENRLSDGTLNPDFEKNNKQIIDQRDKYQAANDLLKDQYNTLISDEVQDALKKEKEDKKRAVRENMRGTKAQNNKKVEPVEAAETTDNLGNKKVTNKNVISTHNTVDSSGITPHVEISDGSLVDDFLGIGEYSIDEINSANKKTSEYNEESGDNLPLLSPGARKRTGEISEVQYGAITNSKFDKNSPNSSSFSSINKAGEKEFYSIRPDEYGKIHVFRERSEKDAILSAINHVPQFETKISSVHTDFSGKTINQKFAYPSTTKPSVVFGDRILSNKEAIRISSIASTLSLAELKDEIFKSSTEIKVKEARKTAAELRIIVDANIALNSKMDPESSKLITPISAAYLQVDYEISEDRDGNEIKTDIPGEINFVDNCDFNLTNGATIEISFPSQGEDVRQIVRDEHLNPINEKVVENGKTYVKHKTRKITVESALKNNYELPLAIYIVKDFGGGNVVRKLIGYVREEGWLNQLNKKRERANLAPAGTKGNRKTKDAIKADIDAIIALREEFKKKALEGNFNHVVRTTITGIGTGVLNQSETPVTLSSVAKELESDMPKYTGRQGIVWGYMNGAGEAVGLDGTKISNSVLARLGDGVPVVMVPTANGMLSPQALREEGIGEDIAKSIFNAMKLLERGIGKNQKDILYQIGYNRVSANSESLTHDVDWFRRRGLMEYCRQYLRLKSKTGVQFDVTFEDLKNNGNKTARISFVREGQRKHIDEGDISAAGGINNKQFMDMYNALIYSIKDENLNFDRELLKMDKDFENGKSVEGFDPKVYIINENGTNKVVANSISEFYMANRKVTFKSAGKTGEGKLSRNVYFVQPVIEFSLSDYQQSKPEVHEKSGKEGRVSTTTAKEKRVQEVVEKPGETQATTVDKIKIEDVEVSYPKDGGPVTVTHKGKEVKFDDFMLGISGNEAMVTYIKKTQGELAGVGTVAYIKLGESLAAKGITLSSMETQYEPGKKLWLRLVDMGYADKVGTTFKFKSKVIAPPVKVVPVNNLPDIQTKSLSDISDWNSFGKVSLLGGDMNIEAKALYNGAIVDLNIDFEDAYIGKISINGVSILKSIKNINQSIVIPSDLFEFLEFNNIGLVSNENVASPVEYGNISNNINSNSYVASSDEIEIEDDNSSLSDEDLEIAKLLGLNPEHDSNEKLNCKKE